MRDFIRKHNLSYGLRGKEGILLNPKSSPATIKEVKDFIAQHGRENVIAELKLIRKEEIAQKQTEYQALIAKIAEEDKPYLDEFNQKLEQLRQQIPNNQIEVKTVIDGSDYEGLPNLRHEVDGIIVNKNEVYKIGYVTASRPRRGLIAEAYVFSMDKNRYIALKQEKEQQQQVEKDLLIRKEQEMKVKFDQAKETGQPVFIKSWTAMCNDPKEECNTDIISQYAMPDGTTKTKRDHTW